MAAVGSGPAPSVTFNEARRSAQNYLDARLGTEAPGGGGGAASKPGGVEQLPFDVPVIDISPSFNSPEGKAQAAAQIRAACMNSGFFQITGHGVSASARASVLTQAERFFKTLTLAQKESLHIKHSTLFRGWEPADYTNVNPADWSSSSVPETKEGFNWGYEPDMDSTGGDGGYVELDGSRGKGGNAWPRDDDLPGFYDGIRVYYAQVLDLARHLFRLFALGLGLDQREADALTTHPGGIGRLLYYPPGKDPKPLVARGGEDEIGLGAHTDYENFTVLLSSTRHGLEVLSPGGDWTEVDVVDGALVINVGDFMMRLTNGLYRSTVHRVVNRTALERYSVPFFFGTNYDAVIETLPSCISANNPAKYPPIAAGEYILERLRATTQDG